MLSSWSVVYFAEWRGKERREGEGNERAGKERVEESWIGSNRRLERRRLPSFPQCAVERKFYREGKSARWVGTTPLTTPRVHYPFSRLQRLAPFAQQPSYAGEESERSQIQPRKRAPHPGSFSSEVRVTRVSAFVH
ncbi:uncharacterized protein SPSK_10011 [Sporothrix schenckii 1099-18]|uniref:Uncharacterized protein n=1 Tax=Sporothrix schenckii 1099-18 TaxID=1397361 RepID=A0A0F2M6L2_SPOSC|nr:uncharacterized protein SPSK_10011 [Sporothrix schenckii 1099-18]KJR85257.1 hypothetical protein SPSK_10011 [Sporothrix schenckii 1099-18]